MGPFTPAGTARRTFTIPEIKIFQNLGDGNMGYQLTSSFASANAALLANHTPFSTKMAGSGYANYADADFAETVVADFAPLTNNTGASLDINLWQDASLVDADNDVIKVMQGTLVNFRGCGDSGNNHNRLTLLNNDQTIRFQPRPGFFGRAQFGFNLWDGKEKGSFVIYTIDVVPGTAVSYSAGNEMIVNGNFEDGSEVSQHGPNEPIPNGVTAFSLKEGKLNRSTHFSDGHPYGYRSNYDRIGGGPLIYNSQFHCSYTSNVHYFVGNPNFSFPSTTVGLDHPGVSAGERYQSFAEANSFSLYSLKGNLQSCHYYVLEYDIYSSSNPNTSLTVGFANTTGFNWPLQTSNTSYNPNLIFTTTSDASPGTGSCEHVTTGFWYCGNDANLLYIKNNMQWNGLLHSNRPLIDNVSLKEDLTPPPMTVTIVSSGACSNLLTAEIDGGGCSATYQWKINGTNIAGATNQSYVASTLANATYTVEVTSCGQTASDNHGFIVTTSTNCQACAVFGNTTLATELGANGLLGPTVINGAGPYYIDNDITISGSVTFINTVVYVGPGVAITVPNGSDLALSNAHLFGCDLMWDGIVLTGEGRFSAINNTLIEDAGIGVKTVGATLTGSQPIISCNGAIFNRCGTGIYIEGINQSDMSNYYQLKNTIFTSRDLTVGYSSYPMAWPATTVLKANNSSSIFEAPYHIKTLPAELYKNGYLPAYGIYLKLIGQNVGSVQNPVYNELQIGTAASGTSSSFFNIFDNLGYGIYSLSACFSSVNNVFMNLQGPVNNGYGTGIYAVGTPVTSKRMQVYIPAGSDQPNKFYDCYRAVVAEGHRDVVGKGSYIISSKENNNPSDKGIHGYKITSENYHNIDLSQNQIYNCKAGIYFNATGGNDIGEVKVKNNTIAPAPTGQSINNRSVLKAIEVENTFTCTGCPSVVNPGVDIDHNTLRDVYNGIFLRNYVLQQSSTSMNTVSLIDDGLGQGQYGISHEGNSGTWIHDNDVTGFGYTNTDLVRGVYSVSGGEEHIHYNDVENIGRCFEFSGVHAAYTQWIRNNMTDGGKGFVLTQTNIGPQIGSNWPCDNAWLGSNWSLTYPQTYTINSDPNQSFLRVQNTLATLPTYNKNILGDPLLTYDYNNGNGIGLGSGPYMDPCMPSYQAPVQPPLFSLQNMPFPGNENVGDFLAQYGGWQALQLSPRLADSLSYLQPFVAMGLGGRFGMLARVDSTLAVGDLAAAQALLLDTNLLQPQPDTTPSGLIIYDHSDANKIVENYIKFYELYIAYLDSSMTGADSTHLDSLASLCPAKNGKAVLMARSLYHRITDGLRIFHNNCSEEDPGEGGGQGRYATPGNQPVVVMNAESIGYSLLPNPNNGNFIVQQAVADERPVEAEVWNSIGVRIYKAKLNFKARKSEVQLRHAVPGNYLLKLNDSKGDHYTLKFTVL
jgi:hypothetical protein